MDNKEQWVLIQQNFDEAGCNEVYNNHHKRKVKHVIKDRNGEELWVSECDMPEPMPLPEPLAKNLTKREHFAGLAMQGILANEELREKIMRQGITNASVALEEADALLAALEESEDE